jgi:hypothetical protein
MMTEIIKIAVEVALPILLGYLVWLLKEERKERKANTEGMKEILGYMIDRWHEEFILQGYVTTDQRNTFEGVYKAYAANKGNGAREAKWREVQQMRIDDTKSSLSPILLFYLEQKQGMKEKGQST